MAAVQIHNIVPTEDKVGLKSNGLMLGQGMGLKKEPLVPIMIIRGEIEMPQTIELCLLSKLDKQQRIDEIISNPVETFETVRKLKAENASLRAEAAERREDHMKLVEENHELRQQLAASQLEAKRLREALTVMVAYAREDGCGLKIADEALSSPTSTEALDAYVTEKVKENSNELERERLRLAACGTAALGYFEGCCDEYKSASLDDTLRLYAKAEQLTRQRDLAVSALEKIEKWIGEFPASGRFYDEPFNLKPISYGAAFGSNGERDYMRNVAKNALAAIKESEV